VSEATESAATVLVIEDDVPMRRFLRAGLENEGHKVTEAGTAREGMTMILGHPPDLILLDLGLPDADGMTVLHRVREWSQVPVVILSARGREADKVDALNAGADDYLTKPFGVSELLARVRVALRHSARLKEGAGEASSRFEAGDLVVDLAARRVTIKGEDVHLTRTEYRLLTLFVRNAGKVLTHRYLLQEVWGPGCALQTHYPRMYVAALRRKLEEDPAEPRYLLTEQGVGYRLLEGS
jgi:two-component system, OmpR family, KDP operon response regulator KdpE